MPTASAAASARTHAGVPSPAGGGAGAGRAEQLARGVGARRRHEDVARAGGEEVRHVEAAGAARPATGRPPRAACPAISSASAWLRAERDAHERALGVLRPDLARALARLGSAAARRRPRRRGPAASRSRGRSARRPPCSARARRAHERRAASTPAVRPRARPRRPRRRRSARRGRRARRPFDADDHVQRLGIEGEVDVGLRRDRAPSACASGRSRRARSPASSIAVWMRYCSMPVDLVAQRAAAALRARWTATARAVARGDHPAALVRRVRARVRDDLVEQRAGDPHALLGGAWRSRTGLRAARARRRRRRRRG